MEGQGPFRAAGMKKWVGHHASLDSIQMMFTKLWPPPALLLFCAFTQPPFQSHHTVTAFQYTQPPPLALQTSFVLGPSAVSLRVCGLPRIELHRTHVFSEWGWISPVKEASGSGVLCSKREQKLGPQWHYDLHTSLVIVNWQDTAMLIPHTSEVRWDCHFPGQQEWECRDAISTFIRMREEREREEDATPRK